MERIDLFSKERAIRGAKVGAGVSLAVVGASALISGVGTEVIHPGSMATALEFVYEHPTEILEVVGVHTAYWAAIGAAINSFRPTSRLAERAIRNQVEIYKSTREIFSAIRGGSQTTYHFLRQFDFSRIPFNLTRPDQSDLRKRLFVTAPTLGAFSGTMLWGMFKILNVAENLISSKSDIFTQTIADHPIETIGGMTVAGLVTAGTRLAFQKD